MNVDQLSDLDHVATNATSAHCEAQLYIFDEAVIKRWSSKEEV